jgi:IS30 family transposase
MDTMLGAGSRDAVLVLIERRTGKVQLGKLADRTARGLRQRAIQLLRQERRRVWTLTADNGTEFHQYAGIERALGAQVYFAPPYQAWMRATCENTIGLVRQFPPKGMNLAGVPRRTARTSSSSSIAGRGSGLATKLRRNAMSLRRNCCTSQLNSHGASGNRPERSGARR